MVQSLERRCATLGQPQVPLRQRELSAVPVGLTVDTPRLYVVPDRPFQGLSLGFVSFDIFSTDREVLEIVY